MKTLRVKIIEKISSSRKSPNYLIFCSINMWYRVSRTHIIEYGISNDLPDRTHLDRVGGPPAINMVGAKKPHP